MAPIPRPSAPYRIRLAADGDAPAVERELGAYLAGHVVGTAGVRRLMERCLDEALDYNGNPRAEVWMEVTLSNGGQSHGQSDGS